MTEPRVIDVVADWEGLGGAVPMGRLTATSARGKEVFAFEYDKAWLRTASRQQLDPTLALFGGLQYPAKDRPNFGVFLLVRSPSKLRDPTASPAPSCRGGSRRRCRWRPTR